MEDVSLWDQIWVAALAAIPGVIALAWNWFKGYAAKSESKTDDEIVRVVEDTIAKMIAKDEKAE